MKITEELVEEFLKCKNDIVYFAENYIQHTTPYGIKKLELYPYQIQILEDDILTSETSRQIGFSLCSHIKIIHSIIFNQEKTIAFYTPNRDRSSHSIQSIVTLLDLCTLPEVFKPKFVTRNKSEFRFDSGMRTELRFDNDMRVVSASNISHIRGYGISELYMEEVDFYKDPIEEILHTTFPSLMSNKNPKIWAWGCLMNGNIDKARRLLEHLKNHNHYNLAWYVIPNRDSKWKSQTKLNVGEGVFNQEYNNKDTG